MFWVTTHARWRYFSIARQFLFKEGAYILDILFDALEMRQHKRQISMTLSIYIIKYRKYHAMLSPAYMQFTIFYLPAHTLLFLKNTMACLAFDAIYG